jgi:hypothetical protein
MARFRTHDLTLNQNSKSTVGCSRVLIEVLVVGYHTASLWRTKKSHFQPSVKMGRKNVDKNIDMHNKQ